MKHNLLIAHGGGPTAVVNASLAGVIRSAQKEKNIGKIMAARYGVEGLLGEDFIDLTDLDRDNIKRLKTTPASAIGTCRYKVKEEDYNRIVEVFHKHDIEYFFYVGGNDSMDTCNKIYSITDDVNVIGIPKTIDNDLAMTDHCPGFGSAARYIDTIVKHGVLIGSEKSMNTSFLIIQIIRMETGIRIWTEAVNQLRRL